MMGNPYYEYCYEDFGEWPTRSNHPWKIDDYENPEAVCCRCGRKLVEWILDIQWAWDLYGTRGV